MQLRMSKAEEDAFRSFAAQAGSYFEFGVGGSTYAAANLVKGRVVAIDSDQAWIEKARKAIEPSDHARTLHHVDIGPTGQWGYPTSTSNDPRFRDYCCAIIDFNPRDFDFCLVDGRFRIACLVSALRSTRPDTIVAFHDYRSRPYYHPAEQFGRIIFEAEDISFFIRRHDQSDADLDKAITKFLQDKR